MKATKATSVWFHIRGMSRVGKSIKTESQWLLGAEEGWVAEV